MESEQYVFEVEHFGRLEMKGNNVFKALENLKSKLSADIQFRILEAHVSSLLSFDSIIISISFPGTKVMIVILCLLLPFCLLNFNGYL